VKSHLLLGFAPRSWGQGCKVETKSSKSYFIPVFHLSLFCVPSLFASKLFQVTKGHPTYNAKAQAKESSKAKKKNNPHHEHISNNRSKCTHSSAFVLQNIRHNKQRVCHTVALPFTLKKSILWQKKKYENSNISPCKNIIFKKSSKRNQNPSRY